MSNEQGFKTFEHTPNKIRVTSDQDANISELENSKMTP